MKVPFVGMPVEIDQLGRGKITKLIGKNALVAVDVLDGRQIEWPVSSIKPILVKDQVRFDTVVQPRVPVKTVKNDKISTLNRALESLRFGLVPEQYIEELTLGIEELNTWAQTCFARIMFNPRCGFEVNGPYGTGKSHTLALIRYLARKKGLLTARVEVDGQNVSLSNPAPLLYSLWNSLAENDLESENPLLNLYVKVIKRGNIPTSVINEDYDRIQNNIETIHTLMRTGYLDKYTHVVDAVISSSNEFTGRQAVKIITTEPNLDRSQIKLDNMIGHRVKERPYDFIESLAGHAMLAKLAGYKGLVVTIDEFETEHKDKKNLVRVEETLASLNNYFNGKTRYRKAPLGLFFATIDQGGLQGDPIVENYIALDAQSRYRLKEWGSEQRINLAERIHKMYCEAYTLSCQYNRNLAASVEGLIASKIEKDSGLIRAFIKCYVGMLDIEYGPPGGKYLP